jgi:hypothetical protein
MDFVGPHHVAMGQMQAMIDANGRHYAAVRVRCVLSQAPGEWRSRLVMVHAFATASLPERQQSRRYKDAHLLEHWLDAAELLSFLHQVTTDQAEVDGEKLRLDGTGGFSPCQALPGNNDYSPYPGFLFQNTRRSEGVLDQSGPLLDYTLPYYPDLHEASRDWTGINLHRGYSDPRVGCVLVFLPECRVRIDGLVRVNDLLAVSLGLAGPVVPDLRVKGAWQDGGRWQSFDIPVFGSLVEIPVALSAEGLDLHVIGPDGRVYDYHREDRREWEGQERVLGSSTAASPDRALEEALQRGEGEMIEFKPFIKPGEPKENEIVETVIAFANRFGGTLFIGVTDRCVPKGIEREVVKSFLDGGGDLAKAIQEYIGHLRQKIAGEMNRCPVLEMNAVDHDGHTILIIRVPEGDEKIYAKCFPAGSASACRARNGAIC